MCQSLKFLEVNSHDHWICLERKKKNKSEKQVSSYNRNKTQLCDKWKLLLDGAVFEGKIKEVEKVRTMYQHTGNAALRRELFETVLTERGLDKKHKKIVA